VGDFHRLIIEQLTFVQSTQNRSLLACFLVVVVVMLTAAVIVLRYQYIASQNTPSDVYSPDTAIPPITDAEGLSAELLPVTVGHSDFIGPGAILSHLTELCQEFNQTTQEVQNYTGKREAQIQEWQRLCTDILRRILPILDNITPYLADEHEQMADFAKVVHGRFLTELTTIGVRVIDPKPGDPFDARIHLLHSETSGLPPYQVKTPIAAGYLFRSRVSGANEVILRPAEVIAKTVPLPEPEVIEAPMMDEEAPVVMHADTETTDGNEPAPVETPVIIEHDAVADNPLPADAAQEGKDAGSELLIAEGDESQAVIQEFPGDDDDAFSLWGDGEDTRKVWVVDEGEETLQRSSGERDKG